MCEVEGEGRRDKQEAKYMWKTILCGVSETNETASRGSRESGGLLMYRQVKD